MLDRLDKLDRHLNWTIRIGAVVAVFLLVLGYDASYQVRRAPTKQEIKDQMDDHAERSRDYLDSLLRVYLAPDSLGEGD